MKSTTTIGHSREQQQQDIVEIAEDDSFLTLGAGEETPFMNVGKDIFVDAGMHAVPL